MTELYSNIMLLLISYLKSITTPFLTWLFGLVIIHSIIKFIWKSTML